MRHPTKTEIMSSLVNSSRNKAKSMSFPNNFDEVQWSDRDFYGWIDPRASHRAYLVTDHRSELVAVEFRVAAVDPIRTRGVMCNLCRSMRRSGEAALFTAQKAGPAGKAANSVGTYICVDFDCSLYVRNAKPLSDPQPERSLLSETRIENLRRRLDGFLTRIVGASSAGR